jgi:hypothetical protein
MTMTLHAAEAIRRMDTLRANFICNITGET